MSGIEVPILHVTGYRDGVVALLGSNLTQTTLRGADYVFATLSAEGADEMSVVAVRLQHWIWSDLVIAPRY